MLAGVIVGLYPSLRLGRTDLQTALKEGARGASGAQAIWGRSGGLRRLLVAGQLALCVIVLAAAGLLVRSFARVQRCRPGFDPSGVLTFQMSLVGRKYADVARVHETYRTAVGAARRDARGDRGRRRHRAAAEPDVRVGADHRRGQRPVVPGEKFINVDQRTVAGDYFAGDGDPARARPVLQPMKIPATRRTSW